MNLFNSQPLQLLVVEDSALDYEMLVATLSMQGMAVRARRVETAGELRSALDAQAWDLVIPDHVLPEFSSGQAFAIVNALDDPPPFIIVSGQIGEEVAVEAMRRGASDYLLKGRLARLSTAVRNAVASVAARRDRAAAEQRLHDSQQQLRNLSTRLQTLVDEERASIARELHDEVGGTLTAVKLDLEALERQLGPEQRLLPRRALEALNQAAQATQRIMRDLRPPILDAGLIAALEWQINQFSQRSGVRVTFSRNIDDLKLGSRQAMTVYRTCQEALTNISKHARANHVRIDLDCTATALSLEISDDGGGFAPAQLRKPNSLGLRGLAERARAVNGQLDISSVHGHATLMLWLPLAELREPLDLQVTTE